VCSGDTCYSNNMLPYETLNDAFLKDFDSVGGLKANETTQRYVYDRTRSLPNPPEKEKLKVKITKDDNIITLRINAIVNGVSISGQRSWVDIELRTYKIPVTVLIDNVIKDVFEVPLEGTLVS
jgi:hypothetical protein